MCKAAYLGDENDALSELDPAQRGEEPLLDKRQRP
jgi:hypothetical protein